MADGHERLVERLTQLGFSQYEARGYVGLLVQGEQTGYALANATGVPQPKIYETLRRLLERGAVVQTCERPGRYVAAPAARLLEQLEHDFARRVRDARQELARVRQAPTTPRGQTRQIAGWEQVLEQATAVIGRAEEKVYLSGSSAELDPLQAAVLDGFGRGVTFVVLHFGPMRLAVPRGRAFRHASTEGTLYPSRQARHLAVVADSRRVLWALARDGTNWEGIASEDQVLASVVKGYIRHDIMIQRIYADLPEPLTELYGPGLLELGNLASARGDESAEAAAG